MQTEQNLNAAQIGKMFVTGVTFQYAEPQKVYNDTTAKYVALPGRWNITATLSETVSRYGGNSTSMSITVTQEIGQRLAQVLLPIIVADASQKAQQLADDSKAMLEALGEQTIKCITNMPDMPKTE